LYFFGRKPDCLRCSRIFASGGQAATARWRLIFRIELGVDDLRLAMTESGHLEQGLDYSSA
jgi:hypothetical protein